MAEVAPRRRRHSSVGFHLADQGHSTLTSFTRAVDVSGGGLSSSLNLNDRHRASKWAAGPRGVLAGEVPGGRGSDHMAHGATRPRTCSGSEIPRFRSGADSKIMVLGMAGVGKSESTHRHVATIDEEQVVMEILDTAGQEAEREGSVMWADGYVLVYAINDRASFQRVQSIKTSLDQAKRSNVQCVLVANKADLLHERKVMLSEGESLAQDMACAFYETSASEGGSDITELFHELHREVKRRKMVDSNKCRRRSSAQHVRNVFSRVLNKIGNT